MSSLAKLRQFSKDKLPLILGLYIILQPLLDVLTNLGAVAECPVTAGVVVRTIFMVLTFLYVVFVSRFREKKWCLVALGVWIVYLLLFMARMFSLGGLDLCLSNVKELIKVFFAPFVAVFLYAIYREYGHQISTRAIAIAGGLYAGVILIAYLTGTSFVSYTSSGFGYKGWFYAANEISCIVALTGPITIYYCLKHLFPITKKLWWKIPVIAFTLISIVFSANYIGTKIVYMAVLLYCLLAFVWSLVHYCRHRGKQALIRTIVLGALSVMLICLTIDSPFVNYFNNIYMELIHEDPRLTQISWSEEIDKASVGSWLRELIDRNEAVKRLDQILSRRLTSASPSVQVYTEGGLLTKLLGIGYADFAGYGRRVEFMVEMDPLSILVRQGILGFLVYYLPYLVFIIYTIVQFFKRIAQRLASPELCSYFYSALMAFAISAIAGHALVSPAVSTFLLAVSFRLWVLIREQNQALSTS